MTKKFLNMVTAGIVLASATALSPAAFAQETTKPMDPAAQAPVTDGATTATTPSAADSATYMTEQSPTQVSANSYIGQTVYNANDENIGDINDLIFEKDGGLVAAVVGVGGFLGIGEKYVALPVNKITISQNAEGSDLKLTTTETAESLQAAPAFKTLWDQKTAATDSTGGLAPAASDATTTSSTTNSTPEVAK